MLQGTTLVKNKTGLHARSSAGKAVPDISK